MSNNGTGRVLKTYPFTFESTGYVVRYRRVPRTLDMDIRRALELKARKAGSYPLPPKQKVTLMGEETTEENLNDPAYKQRLDVWNREAGNHIMKAIVIRGLAEWDQDAVTQLKADMEAMGEGGAIVDNEGQPIDDRILFVWQIAGGDFSEISALLDAIHTKSGPTEAAIAEHASSFPGAVGEKAGSGD